MGRGHGAGLGACGRGGSWAVVGMVQGVWGVGTVQGVCGVGTVQGVGACGAWSRCSVRERRPQKGVKASCTVVTKPKAFAKTVPAVSTVRGWSFQSSDVRSH